MWICSLFVRFASSCFCFGFLEEHCLSETLSAVSLQFVYLERFFPLQSQLMSRQFFSVDALIDCWSS